MVAVSGNAPDSSRFQRDANLSQLHSHGSQTWVRTKTIRLTAGHADFPLPGNGAPDRSCPCMDRFGRRMPGRFGRSSKSWSRAPVLPRVSPRPKRGGFADSLAHVTGMGGKWNCGDRIRTGNTRFMRPLPYRLSTPPLKMTRWRQMKHRHLLEPMKTNTTASSVKDSHPLEDFTADLSVFQAHLPEQMMDLPSL